MTEAATELSLSKLLAPGDVMVQIKLHYGAERIAYLPLEEDLSLQLLIDTQTPDQIVCTNLEGSRLSQNENAQ